MSNRNKSRFEKWFSLSRHKRRTGAKQLSKLIPTNFAEQTKINVDCGGGGVTKVQYTHGSFSNLGEHFTALKAEFAGQSELCYTHTKIIVLIRRDFEAKKHFKIFEQLWQEEKEFLLKNLNTRWLVSAADTFADYTNDDAVRGLSVACACLLNTVKMQESERFITNAQKCTDDKAKITKLTNGERFALPDGISVFKFGTDDTLRNMRWRINKVAKLNIAGEILLEIFLRLQQFDTVYKRSKERHSRNKTGWW